MAQVTLNQFSAQFQKDVDTFGKMDPYFIILQGGKQIFRSSVQNNAGKTPRWPDTTSIMVDPSAQFEIRFFDKDTFIDDAIGTTYIPAAQLLQPGMKSIPFQGKGNSGLFMFNSMPIGGGYGGQQGFGGAYGGQQGFGGAYGGQQGFGGAYGGQQGFGGAYGGQQGFGGGYRGY